MPKRYSSELRMKVLQLARDGRSVASLAVEFGISEAAIHSWRKQDRIDRGESPGVRSTEAAEVSALKARVAELEKELAATKRASELFDEGRVVRPKDRYPIVETLTGEGFGLKYSCRLLGVWSSGFCRWRRNVPSNRAIRRMLLTDLITQIWEQSNRTYGYRRIKAELSEVYDQRVNKKLIRSIMAEHDMSGLPKRRKYRTNKAHELTTVDLVDRDFRRDRPDALWMTDITEHPTREGIVFCCVVLDAWSRRVVGWAIDRRATTAMVNAAIVMAVENRRPVDETLLHSDHGPQYTAWAFSQQLQQAGLTHSLGSVGDAYDNAVVESFWGRMQTELLDTKKWKTRIELSTAMFDYIEFYNQTRRHSSLGYLSPVEFERRQRKPQAA